MWKDIIQGCPETYCWYEWRGVFKKSKKFNSCGSHLTSMRDLILFITFYKLHLKIVGGLRGNTYKPGAPLLVAISGGEWSNLGKLLSFEKKDGKSRVSFNLLWGPTSDTSELYQSTSASFKSINGLSYLKKGNWSLDNSVKVKTEEGAGWYLYISVLPQATVTAPKISSINICLSCFKDLWQFKSFRNFLRKPWQCC